MNTTDLTGEFENRDFIATRGDSRIAVTIARNSQTINLNRKNRFLIDDPETKHKLAYTLSKPLKLGGVFNNQGVYKFVLQEVSATDDDNHELGIADYYKYFPRVEYNQILPTVILILVRKRGGYKCSLKSYTTIKIS